MKLALAEVYEVATFYAHFDVVKEGEPPPPAVTVRVCDSLSCAMAGAEKLLHELPAKLGEDVRVRARALHGRLRPRAGLRGRPCADVQGDADKVAARGEGADARACLTRRARDFAAYRQRRRLRAAEGSASRASARATS